MSAQVAADLRAAADVLERDGWTQRTWKDSDGRRCAAQALCTVVELHTVKASGEFDVLSFDRDYGRALDALSQQVGMHAVTDWNDAPGRTAAEVIAALRAAADAAEAQS